MGSSEGIHGGIYVTSFISMLRHLGGVGVFILAALDSSVLPILGAVDALTIVLAARHPEL